MVVGWLWLEKKGAGEEVRRESFKCAEQRSMGFICLSSTSPIRQANGSKYGSVALPGGLSRFETGFSDLLGSIQALILAIGCEWSMM